MKFYAIRKSDGKEFKPSHVSINGELKIAYVYDNGKWIDALPEDYEVKENNK